MADEMTEVQVTLEITAVKDGNPRRSSTGRTNTSSSGEKIPNYLRASTGSCHDFCKFGREHAFKAKERRPIRKGITDVSDEGQKAAEIVAQPKRNKKPGVKPLPSTNLKVQVPDSPEVIKKVTRIVKQVASPSAKHVASPSAKPVASPSAKQVASPSAKHVALPSAKHVASPSAKHVASPSAKPVASPSAKRTDVVSKAAVAQKEKPVSLGKTNGVIAKTAVASRMKPVMAKSPSSPSNSARGVTVRKSNNIETVEANRVSKAGQKKTSMVGKITVSPKPSFSRVASLNSRKFKNIKASPLKNQSKFRKSEPKLHDDEKVKEKTLYVVELKPVEKTLGLTGDGTPTSLSGPSSSSSSSSSPPLSPSSSKNEEEELVDSETTLDGENDSVSEYEEMENKNEIETSNVEYKRSSRRAATNNPEDKDQARKLNFRRGKVVNPHSEYNSPRKLWFRQGRVMGDNQSVKGDRRKIKKREVGKDDTTIAEPESEKVVLRHQDANGKKDSQGLFNNVIEETASKLAGTKKSKVQALVGAFETVISLQEGSRHSQPI